MIITYLYITVFVLFSLLVVTFALYIKEKKAHVTWVKHQNEFIGMMIHELRSPLAVIRSSADMIINDPETLSQDQISSMLKQMKASATELLSVVSNLLDISKLEAGKIELFKKDVNVSEHIKKEVEYYKTLASVKGLQVHISLEDVPSVSCDEDKLRDVMHNLLSNAIKYTSEGIICIETKEYKGYVEVTVSDTGMGIPDDIKPKLFNKFTQAQNLKKSGEKGTGLGLVITKGIIEAHNGRIWIEDNRPKGTKFIFTLPV